MQRAPLTTRRQPASRCSKAATSASVGGDGSGVNEAYDDTYEYGACAKVEEEAEEVGAGGSAV